MAIGISVLAKRRNDIAQISILRDEITCASGIVARSEVLQAGIIVVVLTVVGIAVQIIDVNCQRGVDVGDVAEWVIGVPQEHGAVLSGGLGHIAGAVVEREYSFASSMYLKESRYKLSRCCVLRQDKKRRSILVSMQRNPQSEVLQYLAL